MVAAPCAYSSNRYDKLQSEEAGQGSERRSLATLRREAHLRCAVSDFLHQDQSPGLGKYGDKSCISNADLWLRSHITKKNEHSPSGLARCRRLLTSSCRILIH